MRARAPPTPASASVSAPSSSGHTQSASGGQEAQPQQPEQPQQDLLPYVCALSVPFLEAEDLGALLRASPVLFTHLCRGEWLCGPGAGALAPRRRVRLWRATLGVVAVARRLGSRGQEGQQQDEGEEGEGEEEGEEEEMLLQTYLSRLCAASASATPGSATVPAVSGKEVEEATLLVPRLEKGVPPVSSSERRLRSGSGATEPDGEMEASPVTSPTSVASTISPSTGGKRAARRRWRTHAPFYVVGGKRMLTRKGTEGEILRDVRRTFPRHPLFRAANSAGQHMLANILSALARTFPDIGYCQGMNFVAATFLLVAMRHHAPDRINSTGRARRRSSARKLAKQRQQQQQRAEGEDKSASTAATNPAAPPQPQPRNSADTKSTDAQQTTLAQPPPPPDKGQSPPQSPTASSNANVVRDTAPTADTGGVATPSAESAPSRIPRSDSASSANGTGAGTRTPGDGANSEDVELRDWISSGGMLMAEAETYMYMTALMTSGLRMQELWQPGVPKMKLRIYQFDRLLEQILPRLKTHLDLIGLNAEVLVSQWFITVFAYSLPQEILVRVWDFVFHSGWSGLFRAGMAVLQSLEDEICSLDLEGMSKLIRQWRLGETPFPLDAQALLRAMNKLNISNSLLSGLQEDFAIALLREQLQGNADADGWLSRYGNISQRLNDDVLEMVRTELEALNSRTLADALAFREKIEVIGKRVETSRAARDRQATRLVAVSKDLEGLLHAKHAMVEQVQDMVSRHSVLWDQSPAVFRASVDERNSVVSEQQQQQQLPQCIDAAVAEEAEGAEEQKKETGNGSETDDDEEEDDTGSSGTGSEAENESGDDDIDANRGGDDHQQQHDSNGSGHSKPTKRHRRGKRAARRQGSNGRRLSESTGASRRRRRRRSKSARGPDSATEAAETLKSSRLYLFSDGGMDGVEAEIRKMAAPSGGTETALLEPPPTEVTDDEAEVQKQQQQAQEQEQQHPPRHASTADEYPDDDTRTTLVAIAPTDSEDTTPHEVEGETGGTGTGSHADSLKALGTSAPDEDRVISPSPLKSTLPTSHKLIMKSAPAHSVGNTAPGSSGGSGGSTQKRSLVDRLTGRGAGAVDNDDDVAMEPDEDRALITARSMSIGVTSDTDTDDIAAMSPNTTTMASFDGNDNGTSARHGTMSADLAVSSANALANSRQVRPAGETSTAADRFSPSKTTPSAKVALEAEVVKEEAPNGNGGAGDGDAVDTERTADSRAPSAAAHARVQSAPQLDEAVERAAMDAISQSQAEGPSTERGIGSSSATSGSHGVLPRFGRRRRVQDDVVDRSPRTVHSSNQPSASASLIAASSEHAHEGISYDYAQLPVYSPDKKVLLSVGGSASAPATPSGRKTGRRTLGLRLPWRGSSSRSSRSSSRSSMNSGSENAADSGVNPADGSMLAREQQLRRTSAESTDSSACDSSSRTTSGSNSNTGVVSVIAGMARPTSPPSLLVRAKGQRSSSGGDGATSQSGRRRGRSFFLSGPPTGTPRMSLASSAKRLLRRASRNPSGAESEATGTADGGENGTRAVDLFDEEEYHRLAQDVRSFQQKIVQVDAEVAVVREKLQRVLDEYALVEVEVDEAEEAKRLMCDQLFQFLQAAELAKRDRMREWASRHRVYEEPEPILFSPPISLPLSDDEADDDDDGDDEDDDDHDDDDGVGDDNDDGGAVQDHQVPGGWGEGVFGVPREGASPLPPSATADAAAAAAAAVGSPTAATTVAASSHA